MEDEYLISYPSINGENNQFHEFESKLHLRQVFYLPHKKFCNFHMDENPQYFHRDEC